MIKVLFVCHGNICRSPMAEFLFKDLVKKSHLENNFYIESCATSDEAEGCRVHSGTAKILKELGIDFSKKVARRITAEDFKNFDFILTMDNQNLRNLGNFKHLYSNNNNVKVCKLLDFTNNPRDIADPYYTRNFNLTYNDILEGLNAFLTEVL